MVTIADYLDKLRCRFAGKDDGNQTISELLTLAAELPPLAREQKTEATRFHGCQSQIWLVLAQDPVTGRIAVDADSDARIVRGLLAIARGCYHDRLPEEIADHPPTVLRAAGLIELLAPSRANGFHRVLSRIHAYGAERAGLARGSVA